MREGMPLRNLGEAIDQEIKRMTGCFSHFISRLFCSICFLVNSLVFFSASFWYEKYSSLNNANKNKTKSI